MFGRAMPHPLDVRVETAGDAFPARRQRRTMLTDAGHDLWAEGQRTSPHVSSFTHTWHALGLKTYWLARALPVGLVSDAVGERIRFTLERAFARPCSTPATELVL